MTVSWFSDRSVIVDSLPCDEIPFTPVVLAALFNGKAEEGWRARVGLTSVIVEFPVVDVRLRGRVEEAVLSFLADRSSVNVITSSSCRHTIPVTYDGEDLIPLADTLNITVEALVFAHTQTLWRVAMLGFAPGFGYLTVEEGPVEWWDTIARLDVPRKKVPAGAVGVAAGMTAVYPQSMPGGWNLIGHSTVNLFDVSHSDQPALLNAGDLVRFSNQGAPR